MREETTLPEMRKNEEWESDGEKRNAVAENLDDPSEVDNEQFPFNVRI